MKHFKKSTFLLASAALSLAATTQAAEVSTVPVGYSTIEIAAGNGSSPTITTIGLPLYSPASSIDGATSGVITGITSSTITVSGASWTVGQLSDVAAPFCIRITTDGGAAEGRNLLISTSVDNTADTLTIDLATSGLADLTTLGLTADVDTFEIIECDTLLSLFGEPAAGGIIGGTTAATADVIYLYIGSSWKQFYFDTDASTPRWTKVQLGSPEASNQVLLPDAGILFSRTAAETSEFVITGTVPNTARSVSINASGLTPLANAWPTDITLADTNIESISGWVSSATASEADKVYIFDTSWKIYYNDGSNWRKVGLGSPLSDTVVITAGSAVMLSKTAAGSAATLSQGMPYSL